jgi:hypothetical protein
MPTERITSQVLTRQTIAFESEAEWLAARKVDLTSTEAAALFDCSPYATEFELHQYKTARLQPEFTENDRMKWGKRLESVIAEGIGEDYGLKVVPFKTYLRIPELRMGSSFDFKVVGLVPGEALSNTEDRDLTISECESMMLVLHELRRLQKIEARAVQIVASTIDTPCSACGGGWYAVDGPTSEADGQMPNLERCDCVAERVELCRHCELPTDKPGYCVCNGAQYERQAAARRWAFTGPVQIDQANPNHVRATLAFGSLEECTRFIRATGFKAPGPSCDPADICAGCRCSHTKYL